MQNSLLKLFVKLFGLSKQFVKQFGLSKQFVKQFVLSKLFVKLFVLSKTVCKTVCALQTVCKLFDFFFGCAVPAVYADVRYSGEGSKARPINLVDEPYTWLKNQKDYKQLLALWID